MDVEIRYDSEYAAKTVKGEFNGKKNRALYLYIRGVLEDVYKKLKMSKRGLRWKHIKGHSGDKWNDRADYLAGEGAKMVTCSVGRYSEEDAVKQVRRPVKLLPPEGCATQHTLPPPPLSHPRYLYPPAVQTAPPSRHHNKNDINHYSDSSSNSRINSCSRSLPIYDLTDSNEMAVDLTSTGGTENSDNSSCSSLKRKIKDLSINERMEL
jgi:hypothetical protein